MAGLDFSTAGAMDWGSLEKNLGANVTAEKKSYKDDRFWTLSRDENDNGAAMIRLLPDPEGTPFIQFFNHAGPISRRYHSLELIPGLGKKTMNLIVQNRPYSSFKDMEEKISNFRNPEKYISQRIENEIRETDQKYRLFVR